MKRSPNSKKHQNLNFGSLPTDETSDRLVETNICISIPKYRRNLSIQCHAFEMSCLQVLHHTMPFKKKITSFGEERSFRSLNCFEKRSLDKLEIQENASHLELTKCLLNLGTLPMTLICLLCITAVDEVQKGMFFIISLVVVQQ